MANTPTNDGHDILVLVRRYVSFALAALFAAEAIIFRWNIGPIVYGIFLAVFLLVAGILYLSPGVFPNLRGIDRTRALILVECGVAGLTTVMLGLGLASFNSEYRAVLYSDLNGWRQHPWVLVATGGTVVVGLALMFVGLLMAKSYERSNPLLRRLLYGYDAILGTVLLGFILLLINVLSYSRWIWPMAYFNRTIDWTSSRSFSLSPSSTEFLKELKKPIKVYVMLINDGGPLVGDVETLLENCRTYNPRITWTSLSRDRNRKEIQDLAAKYHIAEPEGLLVLAGSDSENVSEFIPVNDISGVASVAGEQFSGETALIKSLKLLESDKAKTRVYFTQGQGELSVSDRNDQKIDVGLGRLWDQLGEGNYELKEFKFGDATDNLGNADVVVIAGGTRYLPGDVDALRKYLRGDGKKPGKLIVMLDANILDGKMEDTGLEPLLAEFNVQVRKDLVLTPQPKWDDPRRLVAMADPRSDNPVSRAFIQADQAVTFTFYKARSVAPIEADPARAPFKPDSVIVTLPQLYCWPETELDADPFALAADRWKNKQAMAQLARSAPPSLAMAVSQSAKQAHQNPMAPPPESQPLMMVFGDASWVSNKGLSQSNLNLFVSCLSWLRGKADLGVQPTDPRTRNNYQLDVLPDRLNQLLWLPGVVILMGVVVLGGGVWLVRRR